MTLAIIVPTASIHQWPARASLPGLAKTVEHLDAEIVPVESSGSDFSFSKSINAGVERAKDADAWVLVNDDCFMDVGWLDAMLEASKSHPEAGILGALLLYPDSKRIQHAGAYIAKTPLRVAIEVARFVVFQKKPLWAFEQLAKGHFLYTGHHRKLAPNIELDYITAACMMITRPCYEALGRFDESYPLSCEDVDYSLRALEAGFELCLVTDATGIHYEFATTGAMNFTRLESWKLLCEKWPLDRVLMATRGRKGILHPSACDCLGG